VKIDGAAPVPLGSGVYFLLRRGEVVYVGQAVCVARRIGAHIGEKDFDAAIYIPCDRGDLDRIEQQFITEMNPLFNRRGCRYRSVTFRGETVRVEARSDRQAAHVQSFADALAPSPLPAGHLVPIIEDYARASASERRELHALADAIVAGEYVAA
jgi:hypothetical protein